MLAAGDIAAADGCISWRSVTGSSSRSILRGPGQPGVDPTPSHDVEPNPSEGLLSSSWHDPREFRRGPAWAHPTWVVPPEVDLSRRVALRSVVHSGADIQHDFSSGGLAVPADSARCRRRLRRPPPPTANEPRDCCSHGRASPAPSEKEAVCAASGDTASGHMAISGIEHAAAEGEATGCPSMSYARLNSPGRAGEAFCTK